MHRSFACFRPALRTKDCAQDDGFAVIEACTALYARRARRYPACLTQVGRLYWRSFLHPSEGLMHSTSQTTKWTPYEVKAAAITYERRSEDLQLEQL